MRLVAAAVTGVLLAAAAGLLPEARTDREDPAWFVELCAEFKELSCEP